MMHPSRNYGGSRILERQPVKPCIVENRSSAYLGFSVASGLVLYRRPVSLNIRNKSRYSLHQELKDTANYEP